MTEKPPKSLEEVVREDGRYPMDAFAFLHDGLGRAVKEVYGEEPDAEGAEEELAEETPARRPRHVTGEQLCHGVRDEALERWGLLARPVLQRWNIHATIDFGNMVYLLIENGLMDRTEEDSVEDFRDVYDFETAFAPKAIFEADS